MEELGQILFAFGVVFSVMELKLNLRIGKIGGAVGPVLMVVGGLMWFVW